MSLFAANERYVKDNIVEDGLPDSSFTRAGVIKLRKKNRIGLNNGNCSDIQRNCMESKYLRHMGELRSFICRQLVEYFHQV